jgi:hypothetical protein
MKNTEESEMNRKSFFKKITLGILGFFGVKTVAAEAESTQQVYSKTLPLKTPTRYLRPDRFAGVGMDNVNSGDWLVRGVGDNKDPFFDLQRSYYVQAIDELTGEVLVREKSENGIGSLKVIRGNYQLIWFPSNYDASLTNTDAIITTTEDIRSERLKDYIIEREEEQRRFQEQWN